jgi:hypothetical protein
MMLLRVYSNRSSVLTVAITDRYKTILVIGFILLSIVVGCPTILTGGSSPALWIISQILVGTGAGLALTATMPAVAVATAYWAFTRSFGAIRGPAMPSAVFNSRFDGQLSQISDPSLRELLARVEGHMNMLQSCSSRLSMEILIWRSKLPVCILLV